MCWGASSPSLSAEARTAQKTTHCSQMEASQWTLLPDPSAPNLDPLPLRLGISVDFSYQSAGKSSRSHVYQWARVNNENCTQWALSAKLGPLYVPVPLPYLILDCAEDYSSTIIGVPDRSYLWIMARSPAGSAALEAGIAKAARLGYDVTQIEWVSHNASAAKAATQDQQESTPVVQTEAVHGEW